MSKDPTDIEVCAEEIREHEAREAELVQQAIAVRDELSRRRHWLATARERLARLQSAADRSPNAEDWAAAGVAAARDIMGVR